MNEPVKKQSVPEVVYRHNLGGLLAHDLQPYRRISVEQLAEPFAPVRRHEPERRP